MNRHNTNREINPSRILTTISRIASIMVVVIALTVLAGWILDIPFLKSLHPSLVSMKANAAIAFLLSGIALYLLAGKNKQRHHLLISLVLTSLILLIGLTTVWQYLFHVDIKIDELFFTDDPFNTLTSSPGRMAMRTALGFVILAVSILLNFFRQQQLRVLAQILAILLFLLSILPIMGYLYNVQELYGHNLYSTMALHTAICFFFASIALLLIRPESGIVGLALSKGSGGYFARRLIPLVIIVPIILMWFRIMIEVAGMTALASDLSVFFVTLILIFILLVWHTASSLNKMENERAQTQTEARSLHELMQYIIQHAPSSIAVHDNDLRYVFVSERYLNDYKIQEIDIIGKYHYDVFPEIPERWREVHRRALQGEILRSESDVFHRQDGSIDYTRWECRPWHKADGSIGGVILFTEVITERKLLELQLEKTASQLKMVLDSAGDGIFAVDNLGKARMINMAALKMLQYEEEELLGQDMHPVHHPNKENGDSYPIRKCPIYRAFREGKVHTTDHAVFWRKDGSSFPVEYVSTPIIENGKVTGAVVSFRDISNRKAAENEIKMLNESLESRVKQRTEQLQAANKELEAFSYSVSHDLRAPLRAIDGFTRMLVEDHTTALDDDGKRVCTVIRDNTRKMGQLIDDLLTLSRLSRAEIEHFKIDMKTLANSMYYELTTEDTRKNIDFSLDMLHPAMGDPTMIRQLWVNLISNALKYSNHVEKPVIKITSKKKNRFCTYNISDNGVGFDMKYVDKIFGVFQRLHSSKEFEGTGVGLAIVQRVVHRHGGKVTAFSEPGMGATFTFSLPTVNKID